MRFSQAILATALLSVSAIAHPISMSNAVVNVREAEVLVELKIMLEDLVMFHGLKADKTTLFAANGFAQRVSAQYSALLIWCSYLSLEERESEGEETLDGNPPPSPPPPLP